MKVHVHPDPAILEAQVLARVREAKEADRLGRVVVIVPTNRLADHVRRRIAATLGACLGVEVLHHRALAWRILDGTSHRRLRILSGNLQVALLGRLLAGMRGNRLAGFAAERPGAVRAILGTLRDLREASVPVAAVRAAAGDPGTRALAEICDAYVSALDSLAGAGLVDDAGLARVALDGVPAFAASCRDILHHGAYELIGVHLDLVRALDRERPVTFLVPMEPGSPAFAYAENYARRHLLADAEDPFRLPDGPGGVLGTRTAALFDEAAHPEPLREGLVRFHHAQGGQAEVTTAARLALAAVARGAVPEEIAIVARGSVPYAAAIEEAFLDAEIPFTTSLATPLRREPLVHDTLALLRAAGDDFPRELTAEVLASRWIRWKALPDSPEPPSGDLAESFSRRAGIVGGLDAWNRDLPAWAASEIEPEDAAEDERAEARARVAWRISEVRRIASAVAALDKACSADTPRTWSEHSRRIAALARGALDASERGERASAALEALLGLLEEMADLEVALGDTRRVAFAEALGWLERAVGEASLAIATEDRGGIRVLDAAQARGLVFERLLLLGMNAGVFPRVDREDPFLPDAVRARIREAEGRPVPVSREGAEEERLILALLLGSARDGIDVFWQRADASGRARSPSLALREVARIVLGKPDLGDLREKATAIPSHPRGTLEALRKMTGLLAPAEGQLLLALRWGSKPAALPALANRLPDLAPGFRMLAATERFGPQGGAFDARIGPGALAPGKLSVTALERLGRCPLQFFFRHVLRVYELEEPAAAFEIAAWDLGIRVHALLEALYERLHDEGLFAAGRTAALVPRALELVGDRWERALGDIGARLGERLPVLWDAETSRWLESIATFLREDLDRLAGEGMAPEAFERTLSRRIEFGDGMSAEIEGRLDRICAASTIRAVGDYKTGGDLAQRGDVKEMLRGGALQVPLYRMIAGGDCRVELLGVGPEFDAPEGSEPPERHVRFDGFESGEIEAGFRETVRALLRLAGAGRFPLRAGRHCRYCPYAKACRRNHPPTAEREEHAPDSSDFRDLALKTKKAPTLASVRAARTEESEP